jgi:CBS domain-containing protein
MKLKDICVLDVVTCRPSLSVWAAAQLMREHHTGDVVVVDEDDELAGIITDRDIVLEVVALGKDSTKTTVGDVMTKRTVVAGDSEDLAQALERMSTHGVRRIPVVDGEEHVVGIITLDDILHAHAKQTAQLLDVVSKEQNRERRSRR